MWSALRAFRITDAIDILLVAVVLYRVFVMFKETRAIQMLLGHRSLDTTTRYLRITRQYLATLHSPFDLLPCGDPPQPLQE